MSYILTFTGNSTSEQFAYKLPYDIISNENVYDFDPTNMNSETECKLLAQKFRIYTHPQSRYIEHLENVLSFLEKKDLHDETDNETKYLFFAEKNQNGYSGIQFEFTKTHIEISSKSSNTNYAYKMPPKRRLCMHDNTSNINTIKQLLSVMRDELQIMFEDI